MRSRQRGFNALKNTTKQKTTKIPKTLFQVAERSCVLLLVVVLEEVQTKPVVSLLFFLWNLVELLR